MGISEHGYLLHLYYGPSAEGDMSFLLTSYDRGFAGNPYEAENDRTISADVLPLEYPCYGNGDFRSVSFQARDERGVFGTDLRYLAHRFCPGKYDIPGLPHVYAGEEECETLEVDLEDARTGLLVTLKYGVFKNLDVITRTAEIKNAGTSDIYIAKVYSMCLDFLGGSYELVHFHGRHMMERIPERIPVIFGNQSFGSMRGTSSHQHNPFFILTEEETSEDYGNCYGVSLLYSGNFKFEVEKDQFSQTRLQMGLSGELLDYRLKPGESFFAPEAAMAYTAHGFTELSHIFHRLIRKNICRGPYQTARRPVLINNWEATYMDFDGEKIADIARRAAELGIEMLVLDDGWFGGRMDDFAGLGDWYVNEEKLGCTLKELVSEIRALGLKFGIWIEPEMVNENSDLYREHPDWAFVLPGQKPVRCRNQLVLDFSRREVVDGVFDQIAAVLDEIDADYVKMDMNRSVCDVYTATEGRQNCGEIMHKYVLGVYDFMERLLTRYPKLLLEGCSGGGGRFDAGMLYYTPQIWCSDDSDAIERLYIQNGTSYGYPISAVGSHVSAVPNHQTGRVTPFYTRSVVAMAGSFGYELDPATLTEEEKEEVRAGIRDYKRYWHLIHGGDYYRLHMPAKEADAMAAWAFVSEDKKEALVNIVSVRKHANEPVTYIRLKGLDPKANYRCEGEERIYSGSALMHTGIPMPLELGEYLAWQKHFVRES